MVEYIDIKTLKRKFFHQPKNMVLYYNKNCYIRFMPPEIKTIKKVLLALYLHRLATGPIRFGISTMKLAKVANINRWETAVTMHKLMPHIMNASYDRIANRTYMERSRFYYLREDMLSEVKEYLEREGIIKDDKLIRPIN